jgi:hypothetical protein
MGFAWELANVRNFGMPEVWDCPAPSPRHRKPRQRQRQRQRGAAGRRPGAARHAHGAMLAARAASRRARLILAARPALTDHRRAF